MLKIFHRKCKTTALKVIACQKVNSCAPFNVKNMVDSKTGYVAETWLRCRQGFGDGENE